MGRADRAPRPAYLSPDVGSARPSDALMRLPRHFPLGHARHVAQNVDLGCVTSSVVPKMRS